MTRIALVALIACGALSQGCGNTPSSTGDDLGAGAGQDLGMRGDDLKGQSSADLSAQSGDLAMLTAQQACAAFATAHCNKLQLCDPHALAHVFGDMATCVTREQINCPLRLQVAGTPEGLLNCANAYPGATCGDIFRNNPPMACRPAPGPLADNMGCGVNGQCRSTYCPIDPSTGCGKCTARLAAGGTCTSNADCDHGLVCPILPGMTTGKCAVTLGLGAACSVDVRCQWGLGCVGGKCTTYLTVGATCSGAGCDVTQGLYCNAMKKCDLVKYAVAPGMCGALMNGQTECAGGALCRFADGGMTGTCTGPVKDGGMCNVDPSLFLQCAEPADCERGTCHVPDPTMCH